MASIVTKGQMTDDDLTALRGRTGTVEVDTLNFSVTVVDARIRFGHLDLRVAPVTGTGEKWVEAHRVSLEQAPV